MSYLYLLQHDLSHTARQYQRKGEVRQFSVEITPKKAKQALWRFLWAAQTEFDFDADKYVAINCSRQELRFKMETVDDFGNPMLLTLNFTKIASLTQKVVRPSKNTSEEVTMETTVQILDKYHWSSPSIALRLAGGS